MHHELYRGGTRRTKCNNPVCLSWSLNKGFTIYINTSPYKICAKIIINAGIKRIVYDGDYPDLDEIKILKEAKIKD